MTGAALPGTVGLFGAGLVGRALTRRLVAAGAQVRGFDPDPDAAARFEAVGGRMATADRVWAADYIISAVFDTGQLAELVDLAPPGDGAAIVSVSTCDPDAMTGLAECARAKGYELIEGTISGTSADVANGDAIMMVAGDRDGAARLEPLFRSVARAHVHVGAIGNGNRAKLAVNLVLALNRAALAEGIAFARAIGLDAGEFLALARESAAASRVMDSKGPKMVGGDFSALGRIAQSDKDARLIRELGARAGQGLPMIERYIEILADSLARGEGDLDNSGILLAIERTPVPGGDAG